MYAPGSTRRQGNTPSADHDQNARSYERLDGTQANYAMPEANEAAYDAIDGFSFDTYERAVSLNPNYEVTDINV